MKPDWKCRLLGLSLFATATGDLVSCGEPCPTPEGIVRSGRYSVVNVRARADVDDLENWYSLLGAEVTVDRDARTAAIVYQRDGTKYEVRYTLLSDCEREPC